jgi:hypothetical protein
MESINTLAVWLREAGLDESALAKKFPDLADIIEDAKKLIGSAAPLPEVGMTVTDVTSRLTDDLDRKIKPASVVEQQLYGSLVALAPVTFHPPQQGILFGAG